MSGDAGSLGKPPARLIELAVDDLGLIEHVSLVLEPAMTALTGETGAGKTLLVGAIDLLLGGRADATMVRSGADEATVEGRFEVNGEDLILTRVVPATGRSRAYINGRMATATALAEQARSLVDLHGQHQHQSLLGTRTQREALDRFAGTDLGPLQEVRAERRTVLGQLDALGGDAGARSREIDLLHFQLGELEAADLRDPDEDEHLDAEESMLANAVSHREVLASATTNIAEDGGAVDQVGQAIAALDGHVALDAFTARLRTVQAELGDLSGELRTRAETTEDDPDRLAELRDRRQLLVELRRKYGAAKIETHDEDSPGPPSIAGAIAYRDAVRRRLDELQSHDARAATLETELVRLAQVEADAAAAVGTARRAAAPKLAKAVQGHLAALAMPKARIEIQVGTDDPGDDVAFLLAANPGSPPAPLAKVASGGELARSMLALRMVLSIGPPVLVFDEVDAGIGGQAALAVGDALRRLARDRQVLVVTHLAQVAAAADQQVTIAKTAHAGRTVTTAKSLDAPGRVVEVSRMLAGTPDSTRVHGAAEELLARSDEARRR